MFSGLTIESSKEPFKCGSEIPITINYNIVGETSESYNIDFIYLVSIWTKTACYLRPHLHYFHSSNYNCNALLSNDDDIFAFLVQVLSKGTIAHQGHEKVKVSKDSADVRKGKVSFKLSVVAELAPVVQVMVYSVLPSENVIASSKSFDVEKCFRNNVILASSFLRFYMQSCSFT